MSIRDRLRSDADDRSDAEVERQGVLQKMRDRLRPKPGQPIDIARIYYDPEAVPPPMSEGAQPMRTFEHGIGLDRVTRDLTEEQREGYRALAQLALQQRAARAVAAADRLTGGAS